MKYYKLIKDLPTFKAGDLFYISEHGALVHDDGGLGVMAYARQTLDMFPNILTEWFEEIQEPTDSIHWNPMISEKCFILENANIIPTLFTGKLRDYNAWRTGKIFRTEGECKKARDRELAEARLRRTSNFKPDFKNGKGGWVVNYTYLLNRLECVEFCWSDHGEPVRYETKEDAGKSIRENREDWLIYFGVEEKD